MEADRHVVVNEAALLNLNHCQHHALGPVQAIVLCVAFLENKCVLVSARVAIVAKRRREGREAHQVNAHTWCEPPALPTPNSYYLRDCDDQASF